MKNTIALITTIAAIMFVSSSAYATQPDNQNKPATIAQLEQLRADTVTQDELRARQAQADRALAGLQTRTAVEGQTTFSVGTVGNTDDGLSGVAAGIRYGFDDTTDVYGVISYGFGGSTTFGVGVTVVLGGGM